MNRLFAMGRIENVPFGSPSHQRYKIQIRLPTALPTLFSNCSNRAKWPFRPLPTGVLQHPHTPKASEAALGLAPGGSNTVAFPAVFPAGVPSTYAPTAGTLMDGKLHPVTMTSGFTFASLTSPGLAMYFSMISEHKASFTY